MVVHGFRVHFALAHTTPFYGATTFHPLMLLPQLSVVLLCFLYPSAPPARVASSAFGVPILPRVPIDATVALGFCLASAIYALRVAVFRSLDLLLHSI